MDTHELQRRLEHLIGEQIPHSTLWDWVKKGRVMGPKRRSFGKGGGSGRYGDWSEEAFRQIVTRLAIRAIRRAKTTSIVVPGRKSPVVVLTFPRGSIWEVVNMVYSDIIPLRRFCVPGYSDEPGPRIVGPFFSPDDPEFLTVPPDARVRIAWIDALGMKQLQSLRSPFLSGAPCVPTPDEYDSIIAAVVIAYEKTKKRCEITKPARVTFHWHLAFFSPEESPYSNGGFLYETYCQQCDQSMRTACALYWEELSFDNPFEAHMVCLLDHVSCEESPRDELIFLLDHHGDEREVLRLS